MEGRKIEEKGKTQQVKGAEEETKSRGRGQGYEM